MAMSRSLGGTSFTTRSPMRDGPLGDDLEAGDHPQRGRLAAARRADEHHELAVGDVEVERADGLGAVGIDLPDVVEDDVSHARSDARDPWSSQAPPRHHPVERIELPAGNLWAA